MVHFAGTSPLTSTADVTLASGVRLHYRQQGPTAGDAIVLLHGYSDSSESFSRVMPLLPAEQRVIAVDLRGHGDSDRPDGGYQIPEMAADVVELMAALAVPSAVIVGHSMGSFIAQAVVERAPRSVAKLVLVGSAPIAVSPAILELQSAVEALTDPIDRAFVREFQYSTIAEPVPAAFMEGAIANSLRMPAAVWKKVLGGLMAYRAMSPRSSIRALVLGGTRDGVFSVAQQTALASEYPASELRLLDGVGHTPHWERPEAFARELMSFAM